ncbi:ribonuclease H-like domain-containing protein [Tanacetum coccineum]
MAEQDSPLPTITAMKIPIIKKGEYDIWSMRMRQYICHTDHNLWDIIVNGDLQEEPAPTGDQTGPFTPHAPTTAKQLAAKRNLERVAIKSWFGGMKNPKKMQKNSQITLIMRNKPDIDQTDIDDLYNNLRVYEDEMKRSSSSTTTSQNLAFLSFENTSRTNEVSTASGDFGTTSPQLENEDLQQIDEDDLEKLDLRWQVAMLTVRVKKFIQKTGRNLDFKGKQPVSLDKSKVECYNCHMKGHFARECNSRRNQGKRSYGDNGRRNAPTNESSSHALVGQDGLGGYD